MGLYLLRITAVCLALPASVLQCCEHIFLGTLQFFGREAITFHPFILGHCRFPCCGFLSGTGRYINVVCTISAHQISVGNLRMTERRIRTTCQLRDTRPHHRIKERDNQTLAQISHAIAFARRSVVHPDGQPQRRAGSFIVRCQHITGSIVVGYRKERTRLRILHGRNGSKKLLHFFFHPARIEIAHNGNRFQIGAIPSVIEVAQCLWSKVLNDVQCSDDIPVGIPRALIEYLVCLFLHPHR